MSRLFLSWSITFGALALAASRQIWPNLQVDAVTVVLILIALLPWLSTVFKSIEIPGLFKIEYHDLEEAGKKILESAPQGQVARGVTPTPPSIPTDNPNLALVALRIEIERRLRALAQKHSIPVDRKYNLQGITRSLTEQGILTLPAADGLLKLIRYGNDAAHGVKVNPDAVIWALNQGNDILNLLDSQIAD